MDQEKKLWYESKAGVITLLIMFFPIGLYVLIKNPNFKVKTKGILGAIFLLMFVLIINGIVNYILALEKEAKEAGFPNYSIYSEARALGIDNPEEYQKYKQDQVAKQEEENRKREEAKRLREEEKRRQEAEEKGEIILPNGDTIFDTLAVDLCHDQIKEQLLSPASAKFPGVFSGDYTSPVKEGNTFTYRNYVDAPNSFGVMLRKNFVCVIDGDANSIVAEFE